MQEEHRRAIQNNFGSLVEQTDLDMLVPVLYEKGVFSEAMIEPYRDTNKDVRTRKRQLYRDIERRGPRAFDNLLEALTETGHWNLVRDLDPNSGLHPRRDIPAKPEPVRSDEFLSLARNKGKENTKNDPGNQQGPSNAPYPMDYNKPDESFAEIPQFHVEKSTKYQEETKPDIPMYPSRGRRRGVLLAFSFIEFQHNSEPYRKGAEVDCKNLKYLFSEIGFRPTFYNNLSKDEMEQTLSRLVDVICTSTECVFIVVSSHGYERSNTSDTDIRCSDGRLLSIQNIVERFNNKNFPQLKGVPKVFVFQTCRGSYEELPLSAPAHLSPARDGSARPSTAAAAPRRPTLPAQHYNDRLYSDILIAHSTLPGFVSHRDPEKGSWYIQALCEVFAARAHDCHVEELFTLVDVKLYEKFHSQTSSIDKWGFNKRLYLHPGLFEN